MTNRLQGETSPYLLQHADNPVEWHPWDDEALALARRLDRPILLSIGYSACHWCHVMAHESFEDPATAAVMNEHFVNIKVDREERPDLDKVYQLAHQLLTQQTGGWPLTMFIDPHTLLPFFGGTYFPKTARYQLPGFTDLLIRVSEAWTGRREALNDQGEKLKTIFAQLDAPSENDGEPDADALCGAAVDQLKSQFDEAEGGFGNAPKFPMPSTLAFLLQHAELENDRRCLDMVTTTLTKMARGGIYDHLGGGFCRYATDRRWMVPHFEKMLYDNGQLLAVYGDVLGIGRDELFISAVRETAGWLLRDMRHPDGAFYAALDADSEGEEGKYYVWRRDEIKKALNETEYLVVETLYGIDKPANFEGRWNLHRHDAWRSVVQRLSLERSEADAALASARAKLLAIRQTRPAPGLDDKILTAWNGLAIRGLTRAGTQLDEPGWIDAAERAMDFLRGRLWDGGTLCATWKGQPRYAGYLDDYANVLEALLELLSARWRDADADFALSLADAALEKFEDVDHGGFFFTESGPDGTANPGADALFHRPKPTMDDALPPGNGVMTRALIGLGHLFGEPRYLDAAHRTLRWAAATMARYPAGHCTLLGALAQEHAGSTQVIVRGPEAVVRDWVRTVRGGGPGVRHCYGIPYEGVRTLPAYLPKLVSAEERDRGVAYLCSNGACSLPIRSLDELTARLGD